MDSAKSHKSQCYFCGLPFGRHWINFAWVSGLLSLFRLDASNTDHRIIFDKRTSQDNTIIIAVLRALHVRSLMYRWISNRQCYAGTGPISRDRRATLDSMRIKDGMVRLGLLLPWPHTDNQLRLHFTLFCLCILELTKVRVPRGWLTDILCGSR